MRIERGDVSQAQRQASLRGYVSLREAAQWASVSMKTLKRWIQRGLPVYQAGPRTKVLLRLEDIERFLTRRQERSIDLGQLVNDVIAGLGG